MKEEITSFQLTKNLRNRMKKIARKENMTMIDWLEEQIKKAEEASEA